jgi:hypothetical protein
MPYRRFLSYEVTDTSELTVGNLPAAIKLHQKYRHRRVNPALGVLRRQSLLRLHFEQLFGRQLRRSCLHCHQILFVVPSKPEPDFHLRRQPRRRGLVAIHIRLHKLLKQSEA